jgi:hypothetical protein
LGSSNPSEVPVPNRPLFVVVSLPGGRNKNSGSRSVFWNICSEFHGKEFSGCGTAGCHKQKDHSLISGSVRSEGVERQRKVDLG